ncbi:MAG: hypothetical protein ACI8XO_003630 [Verrucomicrobiales bacterium]
MAARLPRIDLERFVQGAIIRPVNWCRWKYPLLAIACFAFGWALARWSPVVPDADSETGPTASVDPSAPIEDTEIELDSIVHASERLQVPLNKQEKLELKYAQWAERSPRAAIDAAFKHLPDGYDERGVALEAAVRTVAEKDPDLALLIVLPYLDDLERDSPPRDMDGRIALSALFGTYATGDHRAAAHAVAQCPAGLADPWDFTRYGSFGDGRSPLLYAAGKVAKHWPNDDFPAQVVWAAELCIGEFEGPYDYTWLVDEGWEAFEAAGGELSSVLAKVAEIGDEMARDCVLFDVIDRADPELIRRAIPLLSEERRGQGWASLASAIEDPIEAMQLVIEHWEAIGDATVIDDIGGLVGVDPSAQLIALDLFLTLPEPGQQRLLESWAWEAGVPEDPFDSERVFAANDDLLAIIEALPGGETKSRAVGALAQSWVAAEPEAASRWVASLPEGSGARDAAVASLVREIAVDAPDTATTWAATIADRALRERYLRVALRQYVRSDPDAAVGAIHAAELSEIAERSLLDSVPATPTPSGQ